MATPNSCWTIAGGTVLHEQRCPPRWHGRQFHDEKGGSDSDEDSLPRLPGGQSRSVHLSLVA
jgi:hypothetical protein